MCNLSDGEDHLLFYLAIIVVFYDWYAVFLSLGGIDVDD
jgi:hypothetical protein